MEKDSNSERRKASLQGKGRDILLGQQSDQFDLGGDIEGDPSAQSPASAPKAVDPSSLALSDEEAGALLGFSFDDAGFDLDLPLPEQPDVAMSDWASAPQTQQVEPANAIDDEFSYAANSAALPGRTQASTERAEMESISTSQSTEVGGALPLGERAPGTAIGIVEAPYQPASDVEALVPIEPEYWADVDDDDEGGLLTPTRSLLPNTEEEASEAAILPEPFETSTKRTDSSALFGATATPDQNMMEMLVDDDRIRTLADRIETLQEELATDFTGPRTAVDTFQKELLMANGILLEGRENYDDANAVVFRVWADMNRIRRTEANILRYRPMLLNYYVGWGVVLGVLFLLKALFTGVTEAVGMETASAMYYPMLLGIAGALLSGLMTLERHTTRLRDFDPIHISWYLFNPLLGGVMGLLMFLIASIANEDLLHESASDAEHAITYLLCVVAGMNQNNVLRQLNDLLRRFDRSRDENGS